MQPKIKWELNVTKVSGLNILNATNINFFLNIIEIDKIDIN